MEAGDTSHWQTYTSPTFTYSIQIHPNWKEKERSNDEQKRFYIYTDDSSITSTYDDIGGIEAEFQILTLAYDNPAFTGTKDDFHIYQEMAPGTQVTVDTRVLSKVQNLDLDGCEAPEIYTFGIYSTVCAGENRYVSFILRADQEVILEKHRPVYETMLNTFHFNNFDL